MVNFRLFIIAILLCYSCNKKETIESCRYFILNGEVFRVNPEDINSFLLKSPTSVPSIKILIKEVFQNRIIFQDTLVIPYDSVFEVFYQHPGFCSIVNEDKDWDKYLYLKYTQGYRLPPSRLSLLREDPDREKWANGSYLGGYTKTNVMIFNNKFKSIEHHVLSVLIDENGIVNEIVLPDRNSISCFEPIKHKYTCFSSGDYDYHIYFED